MLTKILNANLTDRTNMLGDLAKAMVGSWGITEAENKQDIALGRVNLNFIYGGYKLTNDDLTYRCLAIVVYTDGTYDIKSVDTSSTETLQKEINIAVIIAQRG